MELMTPDHESPTDETVEAIEQRLQRLEQAVAALGDTQLMEDRVVERVVRRIEPASNGGLLSGAARLFGSRKSGPESAEAEDRPLPPPLTEPPSPKSGWLVAEFIHEVRTVFRMLTDYRYRMSWPGRIVPLACVLIGVLSWFLIGWIPLIGHALDWLIDIVLGMIIYKSMSREVERYHSGAGRVLR